MSPVVVKVGGSLYDLGDLAARLKTLCAGIDSQILIVPGGGDAADVVRTLDRIHALGEESSHWIALRACSVNAQFLAAILGNVPIVGVVPTNERIAVVDPFAFAKDDERRPDHLPHRWDVTSDSIAVRVAQVAEASALLLLKSIDVAADWPAGAKRGDVDPHFPVVLAKSPMLRVRSINLRSI